MSTHLLWFCLAPAILLQNEAGAERLSIEGALVKVLEEVEVPARVDGVLAELRVKEGAKARPEELLAALEDTEAQLALERSAAELEIARRHAESDIKLRLARKAAELAQMEYKRALDSVERFKKSVTESDLDRLRLAAEKAALDVEQAAEDRQTAQTTLQLKQVEYRLAEFAVERRRVRASIAGVVAQRHVQPGEWVPAGKSVLRLMRLDRLRVEAFVHFKKLPPLPVGRAVTLHIELPGGKQGTYRGQIAFLHPEVNPVNGQVRVWAEVENDDLLIQPGMRGTLEVEPAASPQNSKTRAAPPQN